MLASFRIKLNLDDFNYKKITWKRENYHIVLEKYFNFMLFLIYYNCKGRSHLIVFSTYSGSTVKDHFWGKMIAQP